MAIAVGRAMAARQVLLLRLDRQMCEAAARTAVAAMTRCARFEGVGAVEELRERTGDRQAISKLFERQQYCKLATQFTEP